MLLNVLLAPKASPCGVWEVVKSTTKSTTCSTFGTQTSLSCVRGGTPVGLRAAQVLVLSDSYVGIDQQYDIEITTVEGDT